MDYGLSASVWTANVGRALGAARQGCASVTVWINDHMPLVSEMPHGGFKQSGYGKDMSMYALEDYTQSSSTSWPGSHRPSERASCRRKSGVAAVRGVRSLLSGAKEEAHAAGAGAERGISRAVEPRVASRPAARARMGRADPEHSGGDGPTPPKRS